MENYPQQDSYIFSDRPLAPLPNASTILALGICSIPTCCFFGVPGLLCGIIALVLASKDMKLYRMSPERYTSASLSNLKAGKVCAIIGIIFSALMFLYVVFVMAFFGWAVLTHPESMQDFQF